MPDQPSPASGADFPICGERELAELLEAYGPDELVTEVFQLFVEQAELLASRLPELADDPELLALEAHKLKAAAAYLGAMRAAYFCGVVENAAKSSDSELYQRAVADLKESLTVSANDYRKRL
jgi:HPt (histidine-containing phosphotransfer) domain-containing protein